MSSAPRDSGPCVSTVCFGGEKLYDSLQRSCSKLRIWHSLSAFSLQLRPCPLPFEPCPLHTCPAHSPAPLLHLNGPQGQGQPVDVSSSHRVMVSVMRQCGFCGGIAMAMGNASRRVSHKKMLNPKVWNLRFWPHRHLCETGMRDLVEEWGGSWVGAGWDHWLQGEGPACFIRQHYTFRLSRTVVCLSTRLYRSWVW